MSVSYNGHLIGSDDEVQCGSGIGKQWRTNTENALKVLCAATSSTGENNPTKGNGVIGGAYVVAEELGDSVHHITRLTISTTLPAIAGGANLAVGKLLYTFPAGVIQTRCSRISLAITQTEGNITADTPDGGLGTVIGSGAVAVLGGTATFENILTGQTFNDCNGTAEVATVNTVLTIEEGDAHTVYFNVADGWAANGDAAALLTGTVVLEWVKLK